MKRTIVGLILAGVLAVAAPAAAQVKALSFSIGGGVTTPTGGVTDNLGPGGQVLLGLTYRASDQVSVTGEYGFSSLGSKSVTVPQPLTTAGSATFSGSGWYQFAGGAVRFTPWTSGKSSVYLIGGAGVYHRSVYVSTPAIGQVTVCDPSWFICFPTAVTVDKVIGTRASNDPGFSVGGGFTYKVSALATFFAEARYHYVAGPDVANQSGGTTNANGQFFPLTFGFRF
jgi:hypothetical protein